MFTHPFHLNCYHLIRDYTLEYMKQYNQKDIYAEGVTFPADITQILEEELKSYGLTTPSNYLSFKRRNYFKPRLETVHIDFGEEFIHSSIVLPIEGCAGTSMFWMSGEYITQKKILPNGDPYQVIHWRTTPQVINQVEITEPTLCKVDIPHDALSNINGEYRTILSIRLKGNPTFEQVLNTRYRLNLT